MTVKSVFILIIASSLFSGCWFTDAGEISKNVNYVRVENKNWEPLDFRNQRVVIHEPQFEVDSADLERYPERKEYAIMPASLSVVEERLKKECIAFYRQLFAASTVLPGNTANFNELVDVDVTCLVKRQFYGDDNTFLFGYQLNRLELKKKFHDSAIQIVPKIILRQDICNGCGSDGFSFGVYGVYHYKLAIIKNDRLLYYKEYIIPKSMRNVIKTSKVKDATNWFTPLAQSILFKKIAKDLKQMGL
jgi:hypothetical protein